MVSLRVCAQSTFLLCLNVRNMCNRRLFGCALRVALNRRRESSSWCPPFVLDKWAPNTTSPDRRGCQTQPSRQIFTLRRAFVVQDSPLTLSHSAMRIRTQRYEILSPPPLFFLLPITSEHIFSADTLEKSVSFPPQDFKHYPLSFFLIFFFFLLISSVRLTECLDIRVFPGLSA